MYKDIIFSSYARYVDITSVLKKIGADNTYLTASTYNALD